MTTRRSFIKSLAALPAALSFRPVRAAGDSSRLALTIGNSSYRDALLVNPANDARAVGELFTRAGFTVDSRLDTTRADMMAAIERFGAAVKRAETRLGVNFPIRRENVMRSQSDRFRRTERHELVALRQQATGIL